MSYTYVPPSADIGSMEFYLKGTDDNRYETNLVISSPELLKGQKPVPGGCYDAHMGTTNENWRCETCLAPKNVCPGHTGSIDLRAPVKNALFKDQLPKWLKVVCLNCSRLLSDKIPDTQRHNILSEFVKISRNVKVCPHCGTDTKVMVKDKVAPLNIKVAPRGSEGDVKILMNQEISQILERISDADVIKMGKPLISHPRKLILHSIAALANPGRPMPNRTQGNRSNNDDQTALLKNISEMNQILPPVHPNPSDIDADHQRLYYNIDAAVYEMINGSSGNGNQIHMLTNLNRTPNSLKNRIAGGKRALIRNNILSKRVWQVSRSVIEGDKFIKIDEVGIPLQVALTIHIPETLYPYNRKRLELYYMNRDKIYPGCVGIIKKSDGSWYDIKYLDESYILRDGDIVLRNMIDGDPVIFNRQPSLLYKSMTAHKVRVIHDIKTFHLNVAACQLYHADFDGDTMMIHVPQNIQSSNSINQLSSPGNWIVSYKDSACDMGNMQDTLIGLAELTREGVQLTKDQSMELFRGVGIEYYDLKFSDRMYTGRELVSMLLPDFNYSGKKPNFYMPQYEAYVDYNPIDIKVDIKRGQLLSGVLDKSTTGEGRVGSIFQVIFNEYGPDVMLRVLYDIQRMAVNYLHLIGFTVGPDDIEISESSKKQIHDNTAAMIMEARNISERLMHAKLIPPIGTSLDDYYEMLMLDATEPGDDFVEPIFESVDFDTNNLIKMVSTGSKGKLVDLIAMNAAIGSQRIGGKRPEANFSRGRTSPYFTRYDLEPEASGYIPNSYRSGIPSKLFPFATAESRHASITNALTTSETGDQNRISVKNLEAIVVDNMRRASKAHRVILQMLYAETGYDPRKTNRVKFPTVTISDAKMEQYHVQVDVLPAKFRNDGVQKVLDAEYKQLLDDRAEYRKIFMRLEDIMPGIELLTDKIQQPVNIHRVLDDVYWDSENKTTLSPVLAIKKVQKLCQNIPYAYYNQIQEDRKMRVPKFISKALTLFNIYARSMLCTHSLLERGIDDAMLDEVLIRIKLKFQQALVSPGMAAGIIAAQCICEPMTQHMLNSKHHAGGRGGANTGPLDRLKEILRATPANNMKAPSMLIMVPEEHEGSKEKVQEIANHIEMMNLDRFLDVIQVFFEGYGNPVHPKYKHEVKMIKDFEKYNVGISVPHDLINWCIRFQLNREKLVINSMRLETMIFTLRKKFPDMFFVHTMENSPVIILRCYIRAVMLKNTTMDHEDAVIGVMNKVRSTILRGVDHILSTYLQKIAKTYVDEDGSLSTKPIYAIRTVGTNMEDIMENPHIDPYRTQCDSTKEYTEITGITTARTHIIKEMRSAMNTAAPIHLTLYADEMTHIGSITGIQRSGMQKRERDNVPLRISFQAVGQTLVDAAVNNIKSKITGISGPLIAGTSPHIGTAYNKVVVSRNFLGKVNEDLDAEIEDQL